MTDFRNRSKNRFESEMRKLLKDLYVSALDRAEKILQPDRNGNAWKQFRFGILNLGNDKLRQLRDRLEDYTIEFRPAIFSVEYKVDVPADKLVEFVFGADEVAVHFQIWSENEEAVKAVAHGLGYDNKVVLYKNKYSLVISGMYDAFHKVIPFFDLNECFKGPTLERYNAWKEKVYEMEKANA